VNLTANALERGCELVITNCVALRAADSALAEDISERRAASREAIHLYRCPERTDGIAEEVPEKSGKIAAEARVRVAVAEMLGTFGAEMALSRFAVYDLLYVSRRLIYSTVLTKHMCSSFIRFCPSLRAAVVRRPTPVRRPCTRWRQVAERCQTLR